jgi:DNA mismatch repair protein MutS
MTGAAPSSAPLRDHAVQDDARAASVAVRLPRNRADAETAAVCASDEDFALVIAQYLEIKTKNPDHLLFCRVVDFYVLFFDDAKIAARKCGMPRIKRAKLMGTAIPMSAIPLQRADDYLQHLVGAGHGVAVCEQIEDRAEAAKRGKPFVVQRDLVRLVTPGRFRGREPR